MTNIIVVAVAGLLCLALLAALARELLLQRKQRSRNTAPALDSDRRLDHPAVAHGEQPPAPEAKPSKVPTWAGLWRRRF
ncbi:MAG TPA: hypothetical protein VKI00_25690 [Mycobacterium sp.]|uniref:hypothetical protein n=1 Tax=Mycobacterium sp. TaxID=1785 RepID=UPI002D17AD2D|nr:hypothetical protein [Mycobacterium sp.]HME78922.1 hypothetical protein [Mycobacterium sp.]